MIIYMHTSVHVDYINICIGHIDFKPDIDSKCVGFNLALDGLDSSLFLPYKFTPLTTVLLCVT